MGKRPWSSGIRSAGFATWKAPAAMKRTWSVRTTPYLVVTAVPSTMGRRSRWTPSRETSGPCPRSRPAILSISSRKTMPESCDPADRLAGDLVHVDQLLRLLLDERGAAPRRPSPSGAWSGPAACCRASRGGSGPSRPCPRRRTSRSPGSPGPGPRARSGGRRAGRPGAARGASPAWRRRWPRRRPARACRARRRRGSARAAAAARGAAPRPPAAARSATLSAISLLTMLTASSVRSRIIDSTSRPT